MASIGTMRLTFEAWRQEGDGRTMAEHLRDAFAILKAGI
jgi:hypothetical protein